MTRNESQKLYQKCFTVFWKVGSFFFIRLVGGGIQRGPLGTAANDWPIAPAPSDYDDGEFGGMKIGRRNRSTRRKPAPVPLIHHKSHLTSPGIEPGPQRWEASD
jgi:hypothetical protein